MTLDTDVAQLEMRMRYPRERRAIIPLCQIVLVLMYTQIANRNSKLTLCPDKVAEDYGRARVSAGEKAKPDPGFTARDWRSDLLQAAS